MIPNCYIPNIPKGICLRPIETTPTGKKFSDLNGDGVQEIEVSVMNPHFRRNDSRPECRSLPFHHTRFEIHFSDGPDKFVRVDKATFQLSPSFRIKRSDAVRFDRYGNGKIYEIIGISTFQSQRGVQVFFNLENSSIEPIQEGVLEFVASFDTLKAEAQPVKQTISRRFRQN